jgi:hypothetical protein
VALHEEKMARTGSGIGPGTLSVREAYTCTMKWIGSILAFLIVFVVGCTGSEDTWPTRVHASGEVPWSFPMPSGWQVFTNRSEPDPRLRVGSLGTYLANVRYDFNDASPGPNSGGGASQELGPAAAVVKVLFLWSPPDEPIHWNPPNAATIIRSPTGWHRDAQNPGWVFRERRVCLAETCVSVVEWHGPNASEEVISSIQRITELIELEPGWVDPVA